ncbi:iron-siderophore ABC transporter substrate-binding protein [Psychromonas arctica]|uniref:iron-siderophore ABC transporter substrate-binding protein n=1 Tax=Psychromonas arctica TaxID=168275 RepID=UPI0003FDCEFD|nr:iron-siderophore ABC transporter substrate-binding protein [Psychromonas arctica]
MYVIAYFLRCFFCVLAVLSSLTTSAYAEITVVDSRGVQTFKQSPERVVVLNWDLLEQVLALDIIPLAAPNVAGYQQWVVNPTAPNSIEEIGTRAEPNLEKIARLKPDVIIAASPQKDLIPILERIAPVIYLDNFGQQDDAALVAIQHFKLLATLFEKETLAQQKLQHMQLQFEQLAEQINSAFNSSPEVVALRFSTLNSVFLYTENSSTQYVLDQLGLKNPLPNPAKAWGMTQQRINSLQYIDKGYVLYILPFPDEKKLTKSVLWQAMTFVQQGHVRSVRSIWNYGGAMSLLYMAEAITESLLEMAPEQ